MRRSVFFFLLTFILASCQKNYDDEAAVLFSKKYQEVAELLKAIDSTHELHTMRNSQGEVSNMSGTLIASGFFLFGAYAQMDSEQKTVYNVIFSWKHPFSDSYVFSSAPLLKTQVRLTNDKVPLIRFKFKPQTRNEIVHNLVEYEHWVRPPIEKACALDYFNSDIQKFLDTYLEVLIIQCQAKDWPTDITVPR